MSLREYGYYGQPLRDLDTVVAKYGNSSLADIGPELPADFLDFVVDSIVSSSSDLAKVDAEMYDVRGQAMCRTGRIGRLDFSKDEVRYSVGPDRYEPYPFVHEKDMTNVHEVIKYVEKLQNGIYEPFPDIPPLIPEVNRASLMSSSKVFTKIEAAIGHHARFVTVNPNERQFSYMFNDPEVMATFGDSPQEGIKKLEDQTADYFMLKVFYTQFYDFKLDAFLRGKNCLYLAFEFNPYNPLAGDFVVSMSDKPKFVQCTYKIRDVVYYTHYDKEYDWRIYSDQWVTRFQLDLNEVAPSLLCYNLRLSHFDDRFSWSLRASDGEFPVRGAHASTIFTNMFPGGMVGEKLDSFAREESLEAVYPKGKKMRDVARMHGRYTMASRVEVTDVVYCYKRIIRYSPENRPFITFAKESEEYGRRPRKGARIRDYKKVIPPDDAIFLDTAEYMIKRLCYVRGEEVMVSDSGGDIPLYFTPRLLKGSHRSLVGMGSLTIQPVEIPLDEYMCAYKNDFELQTLIKHGVARIVFPETKFMNVENMLKIEGILASSQAKLTDGMT